MTDRRGGLQLPPRQSRFSRSLPLTKKPYSMWKDEKGFKASVADACDSWPQPARMRILDGIGDDPDLIELYALDALSERWCGGSRSVSPPDQKIRSCANCAYSFLGHDDPQTMAAAAATPSPQANGGEHWARRPATAAARRVTVIHPFSRFRILWNMVMLLVLSSVLVVLPVSIAFFFDDNGHTFLPYNVVCDCLFVCDIILSFNTGIPKEKTVIMTRGEVARRYSKSWFVVDFLSILPIDYIMLFIDANVSYTQGSSVRAIRLIKLLQLIRVLRFSRMMRNFSVLQETFHMATAVAGLVKMAVIALLVSHWSACIQFFVPAMMDFPDDSWVVCTNVKDAFWFDQYTNAWFKSLSHELGIGYGQCAALNMPEIWVSILSMFIASTTWLILGAHTIDIMYGVNTSRNLFDAHMQEVHEYVVAMNFPMSLREKIYSYYDSRYGQKMLNEEKIFSELSDSLKQDINRHNSKELIQKTPLLAGSSSSFVNDVVSALKPLLFMPGDNIYTVNKRGEEMYLLQEGVVEILNARGKSITKLLGGSFFGELSLLTNGYRSSTAKAVTYCHVYVLSKDDFEHIFADHPEMRRRLYQIARQRASLLDGTSCDVIAEDNSIKLRSKDQEKSETAPPQTAEPRGDTVDEPA